MDNTNQTFYAGSYRLAEHPGIYKLSLDTETGELTEMDSIAGINCPAYVVLHPNKRWMYAAGETSKQDGMPGSVWSLDLAPEGMALKNTQPSGGDFPCHLAIDRTGKWVIASNYGSGNVGVLPILEDGSLGEISDFAQHEGRGLIPERQEGPHAHSSIFTPDNRFLIVADLGIDSLVIYRFDATNGSIKLHAQVSAQPGAGPRHMAWHHSGRYLYVTNELNSTVAVYRYDAEKGYLSEREVVPTLESGDPRENWVSDIRMTPAGDRIFVANRRFDGQDTVAIYEIGQEGELTRISISPCGGKWPRVIAIAPGGKFLVVANEHSDMVSVLPIQKEPEALGEAVATFDFPQAACIQFVETGR